MAACNHWPPDLDTPGFWTWDTDPSDPGPGPPAHITVTDPSPGDQPPLLTRLHTYDLVTSAHTDHPQLPHHLDPLGAPGQLLTLLSCNIQI